MSNASVDARVGLENWARARRLEAAVVSASRAVGPGIRLAPTKGFHLTTSGLRHPAERGMRDADLVVSGAPLGEVARRLARAGFVLADVPRAFGVVAMRPPEPDAPWLDLHARPLPPGLGRVTSELLFEDARPFELAPGATLFRIPHAAVAVHVIGNVLKDRIHRANAHAVDDLVVLLSADGVSPDRVARLLRRVGLGGGGACVVANALERSSAPALHALARALESEGFDRVRARRALERLSGPGKDAWLGRTLARACADAPLDRAMAVTAAIAMKPARLGRRWYFERATR